MLLASPSTLFFFFFNDTATTEIYTLSLHDALPISRRSGTCTSASGRRFRSATPPSETATPCRWARSSASGLFPRTERSEEHTSELQSLTNLVCRLLLEKKKKIEDAGVYMLKYYNDR